MEFRVPDDLTIDGSKEKNSKGTKFMKSCKKFHPSHQNRTRATESESCRRSNSRSETAPVPDYDQETGATETLGLRNPLDHPSDAENINTSWWIARSVSTRRSNRRDTQYFLIS
jgi:hypothetical protein